MFQISQKESRLVFMASRNEMPPTTGAEGIKCNQCPEDNQVILTRRSY